MSRRSLSMFRLARSSFMAVSFVLMAGCDSTPASSGPVDMSDALSAADSTPPGGDAASTSPSPYPLWFLSGPGNEAEAMATDSNGIAFFSQAGLRTFYPIDHNVAPPSTWSVIYFKKYASYESFQSDVNTPGKIQKEAKVVVYDNESWSFTPAAEQADPVGYAKRFADLAHANGFQFANTPAEDLMQQFFPGKNKYLAFVSYGYAAQVAPSCDYYQIQGQQIENDTTGDSTNPSFDWFTKQVTGQALAANPKVVVLGGVVAKSGYTSTDIVHAVDSTIGAVSGHWLNILCNLDCANGVGLTNTQMASSALARLMAEHH